MKRLVIMRGIPGSGKSTKANELVTKYRAEGLRAVICSADAFFIKDGAYTFDPKYLPRVHAMCQGMAVGAFEAGVDAVIIDNTNMKKSDYKYYLDLARQYSYEVEEVIVGSLDEESLKLYASRNIHGVSIETIRRMAQRFE